MYYYLLVPVFCFLVFGVWCLGGVNKADDVCLFICRYPEELADSSFDNTGCEFYLWCILWGFM